MCIYYIGYKFPHVIMILLPFFFLEGLKDKNIYNLLYLTYDLHTTSDLLINVRLFAIGTRLGYVNG